MNQIDDFLSDYSNKNTVSSYRSLLNKYFKVIKKNPDKYFKPGKTNDDYEADIRQFWHTDNFLHGPPKTVAMYISIIRKFIKQYAKIEYSERFKSWYTREVQSKNYALTDDYVPTQEELKTIMSSANMRERAIFLSIASGGFRINELLSIRQGDLILKGNVNGDGIKQRVTKIILLPEYQKKGKQKRVCFISDEATRYIKQWLNVRDDKLKLAVKRSNFLDKKKDIDDDRIFPYSDSTVRAIWTKLVKRSDFYKLDERTKRNQCHIHCLRKYFRTQLAKVVPLDTVHALMGHRDYLSEYRRYNEGELAEMYRKGMHTVSVFEDIPIDVKDLEKILYEQQKQIEKLMADKEKLADKKLKELSKREPSWRQQ